MPNSQSAKASLLVVISSAIWGLYWMPLRAMEDIGLTGAWSAVIFNFTPVLIAFFVSVYLIRKNHLPERSLIRSAIFAGIFSGLGVSLYTVSLLYAPVVRATILFYLTPIWSTIIAYVWLHEPIRKWRWVAILVGLTGLWVMIGNNRTLGVPLGIGDLFALLSGIFWGFAAAELKRSPNVPTHMVVTCQFICASIIAISIAILIGAPLPSADIWFIALPIGLLTAAIILLPTMFIIFWCATILSPGRVGLLMMSELLVAVFTAALLLPEEVLSSREWIGAAMITIAGVIEITGSKQES